MSEYNIETVSMYKTQDGKVFPTQEEAETHQREQVFRSYLEGSGSDPLDLVDYLLENKEAILKLYGKYDSNKNEVINWSVRG